MMITELLMGVERLKPLKNISILIDIPNMAQIKMRLKSFGEIFSLGNHSDTNQKSIQAPDTLKTIKP